MTKVATELRPGGFLNALGLHRRELRAWAMYDWGISAMQPTISTAVFPIYFVKVAGANLPKGHADQWWYVANTIGAIILAVLAPILGAIADFKAAKKTFLVGFMLLGVSATATMFFIAQGQILFASIVFFVIGGSVLLMVNVPEGERVARDADAGLVNA